MTHNTTSVIWAMGFSSLEAKTKSRSFKTCPGPHQSLELRTEGENTEKARPCFPSPSKTMLFSLIPGGEKEVTFQDIQDRVKEKSNRRVSGDKSDMEVSGDESNSDVPNEMDDESDGRDLGADWRKVEGACAHAQKYGWRWIWIDSCCIDRSSSTELSESINSMYRLYEDAGVCYVYLSDASSEEDPRNSDSRFRESKWFMRGWTLQELIAPSASVVFLDCSWKKIGTRYSLRDVISAITSVP
ncbi:hypothetical protein K435DRAFT_862855, partial [Dendrothele bispora CBS 962.96]